MIWIGKYSILDNAPKSATNSIINTSREDQTAILPSCRRIPSSVPTGMESQATKYHLEINGIAEGPMSAKQMAWKIATASSEDVILFRKDGSGVWLPLESHKDMVKQLIEEESALETIAPSPPKLKLKKRGDSLAPYAAGTPSSLEEAPPPPSFDTPPPPPGAPSTPSPIPDFGYTDDNPPPPPGVDIGLDAGLASGTYSAPTPQLSFNPTGHTIIPPAASTPSHPPAKASGILAAALLISLCIAGYIFFLMKQDVAGSAFLLPSPGRTQEVKGMPYTIMTKSDAEAWKAANMAKLNSMGQKAKSEAATSLVRCAPLVEKAELLTAKYDAYSRALSLVGINAKLLSIRFNAESSADTKSLRALEAAMEIAEPFLKSARADMEKERFGSVARAVQMFGFHNLNSAYEEEIGELESKLKDELELIRPIAAEVSGLPRNLMYTVATGAPKYASGTTDALGLFDPKLSPGDYYVIASAARDTDARAVEWAVAFTVKPLTENAIQLRDGNIGDSSADGLWKPEDTRDAERDIKLIRVQTNRVANALKKLRETKLEITKRKDDLSRALDR